MKAFVTIFFVGLSALAGITAGKYEAKVDKQNIELTPKRGFHLNSQAPASVVFDGGNKKVEPSEKKADKFVFKIQTSAKSAKISFYACDDENTVCEKHEESFAFNGSAKGANELAPTGSEKVAVDNPSEHNFKSDDGRPTILLFSAPWCPTCVRMATETYDKSEVRKQFSKAHLVKINTDLPKNSELSEKFKIKAIPTVILLDKNGEEAFRWLNYQPAKSFAKSVEAELQKVDLVASTVASAKLGDPSAAAVLAKKAYASMDYAEAYKWYSLTTSPTDQKFKLASEVEMTAAVADENESKRKDYIAALEKAIVLTPSKIDQIRWTVDLFKQKTNKDKPSPEIKSKALAVYKDIEFLKKNNGTAKTAFLESTYSDYTGFEKDELLWLQARLAKAIGDEATEKAAKAEAIKSIKSKKLSVARPGEMLTAIAYLREANEVGATEKLYQQLVKRYPNTYVYYEKYARFAQKNKAPEKALSLVEMALKYPEGNEPQLGLLKSQILSDLKRSDEALKTIENTLKLDGIDHARYARVVRSLNEMKNNFSERSTKK